MKTTLRTRTRRPKKEPRTTIRTTGSPILPRNKTNPVGGGRILAGWLAEYDRRARQLLKQLETLLDRVPVQQEGQVGLINAKRYFYQVDPSQLMATVTRLFEELVGPAGRAFSEAVKRAYASGTAEGLQSLKGLLDDTRDLTSVLTSAPYLRRAAYVEARVFEEMKGFVGERSARLGAVLLDQMVQGKGIRDVKRVLRSEFSLSRARAERIARTEITGALRRGRVDEARETEEMFGVQIGMLWFSALSPTTRAEHAALHGKVLTPDEVQEFYTRDANAINCKCSQVEVVMKDGKPLQEKLVAREVERRKAYLKKEE